MIFIFFLFYTFGKQKFKIILLYSHTKLIYKPKNSTQTKNCIKLDARNPIKDPAAAFQAFVIFRII
jgi:hypothetical protein